MGKYKIPNLVLPSYILIRPDNRLVRVSNPTGIGIEAPISAEPWYLPVKDMTSLIENENITDIYELLKKCQEDDKYRSLVAKYISKKASRQGIKDETLLSSMNS